ncbi:MAG TPA: PHP domain-containing protein [Vicinamibacterales bacterium]|nr:PHP domain-containing protein [Vicinamibacterales bacterium]
MIDLHMHTTSSDGRCSPEELVQRAWAAGIRTMSVTDHDTMAALPRAMAAADAIGMHVVPGIEITSVHRGKDVHVLAYFLSGSAPGLQEMLASQRRQRVDRAVEIGERLARLGAPIDVEALVATASAPGGKAIARPQIAQALITAGHVATVAEAFERFLSEDSPAYVPHRGASPAEVVALVSAGGGVASLAHPGYRPQDEIIPGLVEAGLQAIEVFHSSHDTVAEARYLAIAAQHALLVTGGSDYHGEGTRRAEFFGVVQLPHVYFETLVAYAQTLPDAVLGTVAPTI